MDYLNMSEEDKYLQSLMDYYNNLKRLYSESHDFIKSLGDATIIDGTPKYSVQFDIFALATNTEKIDVMLNSFNNFYSSILDGYITVIVLPEVVEHVQGIPRTRK